jgi:hypothetical protein
MFTKKSRYFKVPDVAVPDAQGRVLAAKDLRLLPDVVGTFRHVVKAGDRLDHLSHQYYNQSLQWWQICDANPQFLSPLAMLGEEVVVTSKFPLTFTGVGVPPWEALFRAIQGILGVENVQVLEHVQVLTEEQLIDGETVPVFENRYSWEVKVVHNQLNVTRDILADRIEDAEFEVGEPEEIGRLGHEIVIPPRPIG